ncbi:MAG: group III truncated hemoglobin [Bacteroidota bacterium]
MVTKKEITSIKDIQLLVDTFYGKVQADDLIGPIFHEIIQDKWPDHLEKMYRFWQTILLTEHTYFGSPFRPHAFLPVSQAHFDRWKQLFFNTVDDFFIGEKAEEAKWRAEKMAAMFLTKIEYFRGKEGSLI